MTEMVARISGMTKTKNYQDSGADRFVKYVVITLCDNFHTK